MKIQPRGKRALLGAALGEIRSDLVIRDVQLVNMIIGEIYPTSVCIYDGFISHVEYKEPGWEEQFAKEVVDGRGEYLIPGLIDAHEHIENSTMTPRNSTKTVVPKGITTATTDLHETGNAWSIRGVWYMHEIPGGLSMHRLIDIPSCIPTVPGLEHTGAEFGPAQIEELAKLERVVGLAEVVGYLDVIHGGDRMMDIVRTAEEHGLYLQGHAPFAEGKTLSAYLCGSPSTCHESRMAEEVLEEMRSDIRVDARDSPITKNVEATWSEVKDFRFFSNFCLCADDREVDDILHSSYISDVVRAAIRYDTKPVATIKSITLNSVRGVGLQNLGAVTPGYVVDMLLIGDLKELTPSHMFYAGKLVTQGGRLLAEIEDKPHPLESASSVHVRKPAAEDFTVHPSISQGEVKVDLVKYYDMDLFTTDIMYEEVQVKDGRIDMGGNQDSKFVAVVNRYKGNGNIALGLVKGFGTETDALASTISHDSHNLTIVCDSPGKVLMVAEELARTDGGMCAMKKGKILHTLALPLAGLISLKPAEEPAEDSAVMKDTNRALNLTNTENPLLRIAILALSAISGAKVSDMRPVQVTAERIVPLFPE